METLRHGLNIRTQNVPDKAPNKLQRSPYIQKEPTPSSQDVHRSKTNPRMQPIPPAHLTELYLKTILLRKINEILVITKNWGGGGGGRGEKSVADEEVLPINDSH